MPVDCRQARPGRQACQRTVGRHTLAAPDASHPGVASCMNTDTRHCHGTAGHRPSQPADLPARPSVGLLGRWCGRPTRPSRGWALRTAASGCGPASRRTPTRQPRSWRGWRGWGETGAAPAGGGWNGCASSGSGFTSGSMPRCMTGLRYCRACERLHGGADGMLGWQGVWGGATI